MCLASAFTLLHEHLQNTRYNCHNQTCAKGSALQARDGSEVHIHGAGAAVGVSEVIFDVPRRCTVTANNTVEAFYLPAPVFRAVMRGNEEARSPSPHTTLLCAGNQGFWGSLIVNMAPFSTASFGIPCMFMLR